MSSLKDLSGSYTRTTCSHMEKVLWKAEELQLKAKGIVNIPEVTVPSTMFQENSVMNTSEDSPEHKPFSPTLSIDSGRSTGTSLWPSSKYFVHGGPGFSIGILDSTTGTVDRLPIPFPTTLNDPMDPLDNFSLSEVTCLLLVGEVQVWAGTESGSLHVFELTPGPRLSKHSYYKLPDPICCLKTDQQFPSGYIADNGGKSRLSVLKCEVLVGSANSTLTIVSGEMDQRGSMLSINKCPRRLVHLGDVQSSCRVQCIALVTMMGRENYWCGCGSRIVILHRTSWKVLARLDAMVGFNEPTENSEFLGFSECEEEEGEWVELQVCHLEPTEHGVWSSMKHSPSVVLWDTKFFTPKLKISCFQSRPETPLANYQAQVTALTSLDDLVFVGTQGGYLLIFNIFFKTGHSSRSRNSSSFTANKTTSSLPSSPKMTRRPAGDLNYTLVGASHCCNQPIVDIHPYNLSPSTPHSPTSTPAASPVNILILSGSAGVTLQCPSHQSTIHLYEVTRGSPLESPMSSPQGVARGGRVSAMSSRSLPSGPLRKCSLANLENLPEITLHTVSKGALSYLPLQNST